MRPAGVALVVALAAALSLGAAAQRATRSSPVSRPSRPLPGRGMEGAVVLRPRDPGGLARFIAAVSDRGSPRYGHYLATGMFARRFGPTRATVDTVSAALRARGLRVGAVSSSRMLVRFSGAVSAVSSMARTAGGPLPDVAAVIGPGSGPGERPLLRRPVHSLIARYPAARTAAFAHPAGAPRACAAARAASRAADGLTDDQIAHAYGADGLYAAGDRGAGQHIAIYENEPFLRSDIYTFDTCFFGARAASAMQRRLHVVAVDGGQPVGPGTGEASLDVEDVSALAPGATIDVYEGPYTGANAQFYDSLDEYAAIVDADRDGVVSTSWGLCEQVTQSGQPGLQQAENLLFEQAAAQGQTVFAASGDNGSDDCNSKETPAPPSGQDPLSVGDPASQPYVVAVGGTAIDDARQPPIEQAWNGGPLGGAGGGGISASWPMPAWQRAATVTGIEGPHGPDYANAAIVQRRLGFPTGFCAPAGAPRPCRLVPDVSAEADPYTGSVSVYNSGGGAGAGWSTIGGTSSATPLWAAALALVNASPACAAGRATRGGVGFLSPQLYALASDPARYAAAFHDVTAGSNDIDGLGGTRLYPAGRGFDLATGLGSPQLTGARGTAGLAYSLCAAARARRPVVARLSPSVGPVSGGTTVTITGTGFRAVSAVQIGSDRLGPGGFHVLSPTTITATVPPAARASAPGAPAPQDGAGPANVVVVLRDGRASASAPAATFRYVDTSPTGGSLPTVEAIAPSGGAEARPRPVTILGSGLRGATAVAFGGVPAHGFRVAADNRIIVTPPPLSSSTACGTPPAGQTAAEDVCQVHVRVSNGSGDSTPGRILPPYEGAIRTDATGGLRLPAGCGCEAVTAPDEYDYVPTPRITSVSTAGGPARLASERGGTLITVRGRGFDPLALDWASFGDPRQAASQDVDYASVSGTELQIRAPGRAPTVGRAGVALSITTLAGRSPAATALYAGVPQVTSVATVRNPRRLHGVAGAPDTGGTAIAIRGRGFAGQVIAPLLFISRDLGSAGTDYAYRVSATNIATTTVAQTPGRVDVGVCSVSGCAKPIASDRLWLYPPGAPAVSAVTPTGGSAAGGTRTTITGTNLGCPIGASFGGRAASRIRAGQAALDCGSTTQLHAVAAPGSAGRDVAVTVTTVQSYFTGTRGSSTARFRYR